MSLWDKGVNLVWFKHFSWMFKLVVVVLKVDLYEPIMYENVHMISIKKSVSKGFFLKIGDDDDEGLDIFLVCVK